MGGRLRDASGAVIPNAKVTLTDEATTFTRTKETGADGIYQFTPLKVGIYTVSVEVAGFQKAERAHVTLDIQQHATVDIAMVPGRLTQTVEVKGAAAALQTQQASVQQVIGSRAINDLPLNGRNSTFLAQLSAGVSNSQSDGETVGSQWRLRRQRGTRRPEQLHAGRNR